MTRKNFERLVFLAVFVCLARGFAIRLADPDLWGRFAVGKLFLAQGSMPSTDPFAFTPTLAKWVDHEWLTGVVLYAVFAAGGLGGILIFKTALGLTAVAIAAWTSRDSDRLPTAAMIALAMPVVGFGMMPRAQLFTFVLFAVWLAILEKYRQDGRAHWLWLLPVSMIPWANLHAGFLAGLGLLAIYAAGSIGHRRFRILAPLLVLTSLVTLINLYGIEYWAYLARAVTMARPGIEEWSPVPWSLSYWSFWLLAGATVVGMVLMARRKLPYAPDGAGRRAGVGRAPCPAYAAIRLGRDRACFRRCCFRSARAAGESFPHLAGFAMAVLVLVQGYGLYADGPCTLEVSERVSSVEHAVNFPVRSVATAAQRKLSGNLAVPFNWGEYALWHLPHCRVSMDGRYETVYPESTVRLVEDFFAGRSRELLDRYPTDHVLAPVDSPVNAWLSREIGWRRLATDDASALWSRK